MPWVLRARVTPSRACDSVPVVANDVLHGRDVLKVQLLQDLHVLYRVFSSARFLHTVELHLLHQVDEQLGQQLVGGHDADGAGLSWADADLSGEGGALEVPLARGVELPQLLADLRVALRGHDEDDFGVGAEEVGDGEGAEGPAAVADDEDDGVGEFPALLVELVARLRDRELLPEEAQQLVGGDDSD
eukprot:758770-Hanusia_phi.AAC.2